MSIDNSIQPRDQILTITGELIVGTVSSLWPRFHAAIAHTHIINLEGVTRIDSAGLAVVVALVSSAQIAFGKSIQICGKPAGLDALLAAYRLPPTLHLHV